MSRGIFKLFLCSYGFIAPVNTRKHSLLFNYEITMENVCQREGNLLYCRDQIAYSQQIHEIMTLQTINQWKR
jgi:hypothetical protein